jgi:hypothetical protein
MPHLDEADLTLALPEGFEHAVDAVSGNAEDRVYAPFDEGFDEDVAAGLGHLNSLHF